MWLRIKTEEANQGDGTYVNLDNGARMGVTEYSARNASSPRYRVYLAQHGQPSQVLRDGYLTREDAIGALDEFMSENEFRQLQDPVTEAERAEADRLQAEQDAKSAEETEEVK